MHESYNVMQRWCTNFEIDLNLMDHCSVIICLLQQPISLIEKSVNLRSLRVEIFTTNYFIIVQRGTGLSSPLTTTSLAQFESPKQQAAFLRNFRADSIVKDAEIVRSYLIPGGEPWSVLGQVRN